MDSAAKRRADKGFTEAYEACYLSLIKYCTVRMGDARAQADDCVQEAFLVFYNKLLCGETIQNPRAFLYRTTDNFLKQAVSRYARDQKRHVPLEDAGQLADEQPLPFSKEDLDYDACAKALLQTLSEDEQTLYRLKYMEKRSLREIAELLEITPAAAAKRTSRLRAAVKEKLTQTIQDHDKGGT